VRNHSFTSSSDAAFRSSIDPITDHEYGCPFGNVFSAIVIQTFPYGWFSHCRFSFCTTPRCSLSRAVSTAPRR